MRLFWVHSVEGNKWRLDQVLLRAAERGIRIFILLYKELEQVMTVGSLYAKRYLQGLHKNIKVIRHPDHYLPLGIWKTGTYFWAHHEKLLIIDQLIAFVGGIDLCYGRWDDNRHVLIDIDLAIGMCSAHSKTKEDLAYEKLRQNSEQEKLSSARKIKTPRDAMRFVAQIFQLNSGIQTVKIVETPQFQRKGMNGLQKNQPIENNIQNNHDQIQMNVCEQKNKTLKKENTIEKKISQKMSKNPLKWTASRNQNIVKRAVSNLKANKAVKKWHHMLENEVSNEDYAINYFLQHEQKVDLSEYAGASKLFPGKDYVNIVYKDLTDVKNAELDFIDRYQTPRMPWHDIHAIAYGESARDLARHFIQRWNATKTEKLKNNDEYPYLLPKSYDSIRIPRIFLDNETIKANIQVLRSVSEWSCLIEDTEYSIQQAYLSLIANSKHYVYIENQFFVSMINSFDVSNEICKVLCERIIRAHRSNETYRVYIMLPLLPGFEANLGASQYSSLNAVLHWTYQSISRGSHSLMHCLKNSGIENPDKYICFTSLRTYDELCGNLITEMIYIHSKLMIVDDLYTIIGSANINDRSQTGYRDSEVCILIKDSEFLQSTMNGSPYNAGKFAFSLRKNLMMEHLCLHENAIHPSELKPKNLFDDPVSDAFFIDIWWKNVKNNTRIYEEVFRAFPTNFVESFPDLLKWMTEIPMSDSNPTLAKEKLNELVGNLVVFPMNFLCKENLAPTILTKENLMPSFVFT